MRKLVLILFGLLLVQLTGAAKDKLEFTFPNDGWHKIASPDKVESKKCFVPYNQSAENYTEILIFTERVLKNADITPYTILQKQLGKDKNNFADIYPEYISNDMEDAMVTWCSKLRNTCAIERAFRGNQGIVLAIYQNKAPHYSQNMFGQWSNILKAVKVYNGIGSDKNIIELD